MRVKVFLHGHFQEFHEGPIEINADTIAQAIEGVTRQLPGFRPNPVNGYHRIAVVGCNCYADVHKRVTDGQEIHIVPQFAGGKQGGLIQILLGVVLLAVAFLVPGIGATMAGMMKAMGASMLLGGISQLLAPQPNSDDERKSRYLGAPKNTVAIGTRIPILYGEFRCWGHYLSFDVDAQETNGKS